jgi:hypothetical protein
MNAYYLTVPCLYCGAARKEPCRNTMSPTAPAAGHIHIDRIKYADAAILNAFYLAVPCPYCLAAKGDPCRHMMLDNHPVTDVHQSRMESAAEVPDAFA